MACTALFCAVLPGTVVRVAQLTDMQNSMLLPMPCALNSTDCLYCELLCCAVLCCAAHMSHCTGGLTTSKWYWKATKRDPRPCGTCQGQCGAWRYGSCPIVTRPCSRNCPRCRRSPHCFLWTSRSVTHRGWSCQNCSEHIHASICMRPVHGSVHASVRALLHALVHASVHTCAHMLCLVGM